MAGGNRDSRARSQSLFRAHTAGDRFGSGRPDRRVVRSDSAEIMKAVVGEMRFPRAKQGTHPSKVASQNSEALATAGNIIDEVRDAFHGASIEGWNPRAVHGRSSMLA